MLLEQLRQSELVHTAASWRIRDALTAILLHRLLRELHQRWPARRSWVRAGELPLEPGHLPGRRDRCATTATST